MSGDRLETTTMLPDVRLDMSFAGLETSRTPPTQSDRLWFCVDDVRWVDHVLIREKLWIEAEALGVDRILEGVAFKNFWTPIRMTVRCGLCHEFGRSAIVEFRVEVKHRESGEQCPLIFSVGIPMAIALNAEKLVRAIRQAMVELVCAHEVDEALHFQGKRFDDPHAPGRKF
jgi:hypothetical protein